MERSMYCKNGVIQLMSKRIEFNFFVGMVVELQG